MRGGLLGAFDELSRAAEVKAVVIIGAGTTFISGSDIREFSGPLPLPQLPSVIRSHRERALAGGCRDQRRRRSAAAMSWRLVATAVLRRKILVVGLPEVKLGIMPGAGGRSGCRVSSASPKPSISSPAAPASRR